ncbi:putative tricarboxylic transport membrane protein [Haloechinothrix alba]|uniref:Putative tricarboxylic transport membrane protein n=1 Tax=Haloechinothrix alba TaxID=664784 RepID=A0A238VWU1_9PSEU|nr:tripartite tricarboxylate transporter substrate binding protein [Haloechinothrix alba]SNR37939.1 putative tricarboxylic transport membrane protein [Haloechinothrix alba]
MTRYARLSVVAVSALLAACTAALGPDELRVIVPTPPGGGFDQTARTLSGALEETELAEDVNVVNMPGDAGMAALSRVRYEEGDEALLLQMGLGLVATAHITGFTGELAELTPLARLIEESEAIVVPAGSEYENLPELTDRLRRHPEEISAGGGSQPGGPDHLAVMLLAEELGVDPGSLEYEPYDGGGEILAALLSHEVDFAAMGAGEHLHAVEAGELRVLAVTGPERVAGIDAPTLRELGMDLEFLNWRGVLAPPGLDEEDRAVLLEVLDELRRSPEWAAALERYGWSEAYLAGSHYQEFLAAEAERVGDVLDSLGPDTDGE